MSDINTIVTPDNQDAHGQMFEDGIKLLEDAIATFANIDSHHGKALNIGLQGALMLAQMVYTQYRK